ncbi:hypothetical protein [Roseomonas sp. WA12]
MNKWETFLRTALPRPTEADRARLQGLLGGYLPDRYWQVVCENQGRVLENGEFELLRESGIDFGMLLLASPPDVVGDGYSCYCVEDCFKAMQDHYPAGLLPFTDDTHGNF